MRCVRNPDVLRLTWSVEMDQERGEIGIVNFERYYVSREVLRYDVPTVPPRVGYHSDTTTRRQKELAT